MTYPRRHPRLAPTTRLLGCTLVFSLAVAACSSSSGTTGAAVAATPVNRANTSTSTTVPDAVTYPGKDWVTQDATRAGFDKAQLAAIAAKAKAGASDCLLVTRMGKIVDEHYWRTATKDRSQEVWSATKSYTSTLVGIAQDQGKLKITDKAATYIPEWRGTKSSGVTIKDLLSNDSGRHWDLKTDYSDMALRAKDKTAFSIALGQDVAPGKVWAYNNSAIQTLSAIIEKATGMDASAYAAKNLLAPIGMNHSVLKKDASGGSLTFMGLSSTCRDMARYGYLMLHRGTWNGKQIVSKAWVAEATGQSSQKLNAAYGYLWWLNRRGPISGPLRPTTGQAGGDQKVGQLVPGAPADTFFALGFGNQIIMVDPASETVVVRMGPARAPAGSTPFTPQVAATVVTKALRK